MKIDTGRCGLQEHETTPFADLDELREWRMTISAHRETSRLSRLAEVARRIFSADPEVGDAIDELNDHKGTLTVYWLRLPGDRGRDVVEKAWSDVNEHDVRHEWAR